jgi:hypothetical protein
MILQKGRLSAIVDILLVLGAIPHPDLQPTPVHRPSQRSYLFSGLLFGVTSRPSYLETGLRLSNVVCKAGPSIHVVRVTGLVLRRVGRIVAQGQVQLAPSQYFVEAHVVHRRVKLCFQGYQTNCDQDRFRTY